MTTPSRISAPLHSRAILTTEERKMLAMTTKNNPQKPFEAVAQETGLAPELLRKLVRDNVLSGKAYWRTGDDVVGYCDLDQAKQIAAHLHQARQPVEGKGILATVAAEKYGFDVNTIYNWHKNGWVRLVSSASLRDRQFNEGDIAFARAIADLTGKTQNIYPRKPANSRKES